MWPVVICLVVVLISKILLDYKRPAGFPPGPRGVPVIGNIFDVAKIVRRTKYYGKAWCWLAKEYGPVVGLRFGFAEPTILVSGRDAVVEMLGRSEFDGRPTGFLYRYRSGGVRQGILFTDGDAWTDQKRFTVKTLRKFGFGKAAVEEMVLENALSLTRIVARLAKSDRIKNMRFLTSVAVLNTVWFIVAGQRFDLEKENGELTEILRILNDIMRDANVSGGMIHFFPFLRHVIPGLIGFEAFKERISRIIIYFRNVVSQHKRTRRVDGVDRDFIDTYLAEIEVQKLHSTSSWFTEDQLINMVKDLFTAGVETTNNTIGFAITFLAAHQKIQSKLYDEIESVVGKNGVPSIADKPRMPYLSATLAEVTRVVSIGATTLPHRSTADADLFGYKIRKNSVMLANLKSVHMDPEHWGDPEVFRPERFLNSLGEFVEDPWLIPFGLGRRRCMGESLAKNTMFIFIACLLQKFHFDLPEECADVSLDGIDGFTVAPPDVDFIVTER